MYQIPPAFFRTPSPINSLGIYETADVYSQSDVNNYFVTYPLYGIPNGTAPVLDAIDGASITSCIVADESNLDLSLAYPIVYPQKIALYQVDDSYYAEGGYGGAVLIHSSMSSTFLTAPLQRPVFASIINCTIEERIATAKGELSL